MGSRETRVSLQDGQILWGPKRLARVQDPQLAMGNRTTASKFKSKGIFCAVGLLRCSYVLLGRCYFWRPACLFSLARCSVQPECQRTRSWETHRAAAFKDLKGGDREREGERAWLWHLQGLGLRERERKREQGKEGGRKREGGRERDYFSFQKWSSSFPVFRPPVSHLEALLSLKHKCGTRQKPCNAP